MEHSSRFGGIKNANIEIDDVGGVACYQCHEMDFRRRRQKAVDNQRYRGLPLQPDQVECAGLYQDIIAEETVYLRLTLRHKGP